ncbi:hypothetical protein [Natronoglycomyces albus]|uniref:Uncharacterized protein n=1 Tax=Natronoglycomyces albus TaxID=2811108 RepID=A0A895XTT4_9ACTN|nr:hypothetical protein [Natronoglycomyces albus]QSB05660.1 hypothetical protein JQS30_01650 [Natronoglycomyces albus]
MMTREDHNSTNDTDDTQAKGRKLPGPVYAAAGLGDYTVEKIKEVPTALSKASEKLKVSEKFETASHRVKESTTKGFEKVRSIDSEQVKDGAREGWKKVAAASKAAGEATQRTYSNMRTRGEQRVGVDGVKIIDSVAEKVADAEDALDGDLVDEKKTKDNRARKQDRQAKDTDGA